MKISAHACNPGVLSESDLLLPRFRANICMVRHYHRMMNMSNERLTKRVFLWDRFLNETGIVSTWSSEVKDIFQSCGLLQIFESSSSFHVETVVSNIKNCLQEKQNSQLEHDCSQKPKLRTFLKFKNFLIKLIIILLIFLL